MDKVAVETVVRLHTMDAVLEVGTDPDTGSAVELRTPDKRSADYYGEISLMLDPDFAIAVAHALLKVAATLKEEGK
mgnify:CR=1 FL=1